MKTMRRVENKAKEVVNITGGLGEVLTPVVARYLATQLERPVLKGPPGHVVGEMRLGEPQASAATVADARTEAL